MPAKTLPSFTEVRGDSRFLRGWRFVTHLFSTDAFPERFSRALTGCQLPVATGRRIAVTAAVGGAGTSTVTALMAQLLAAHRTEPILAVDGAEGCSGLRRRFALTEPPSSTLWSASEHESISEQEIDALPLPVTDHLHYLSWGQSTAEDQDQLAARTGTAMQQVAGHSAAAIFDVPASTPLLDQLAPHLHTVVLVLPAFPAAIEPTAELAHRLKHEHSDLPLLPVLVNVHRARRGMLRHCASLSTAYGLHELLPSSRRRVLPVLGFDAHLAPGNGIKLALPGERRRLELAQLTSMAIRMSTGSEL